MARGTNLNELVPVTLANHVVSERPSAMVHDPRVADVFILGPPATTATAKAGGNGTEDLTATSRRLQRYETLLNDILPMVSPEVRALIEEARDHDAGASNGSEGTDTDHPFAPPSLLKHDAGPGGRIILPLPVPSPLPPSASGAYDSAPPPSVGGGPPAAAAAAAAPMGSASAGAGISVQTSRRLSPDSASANRLPSITMDGTLIEAGMRDHSPPMGQRSHDSTGSYGQDRLGGRPTSPTSHTSHGGWSNEPLSGRVHADSRTRDYEAATIFPWLKPSKTATVPI
ncbi:uncharacterized protein Z518_04864 [Rhinocladiella mackenziei CBS 650.93]|uniref:Rhinocladiella mackenziei CBS 650.93 unplaced genomic scaffold supercont1.3, whole genome shotgun sequence n=1 Tax=Rhinocladiella mackenziei CBS 650.93 TaxID=1442369 RepID=A0A0D2H8U2_9EURO|nr:uncharacterized protein Z518_04864 [Rhinocladiella mackenziei CBS 650.93]KIX06888.1 hypothetical protein Z518_04864 [Rhinocladiella mackenziei CBS 650.93]